MVLGHDLSKVQRTKDVRITEEVSFETMLLRRATFKGLKEAGFIKPSPIQLHGIPLGKCGFDLLLEAKSGTGKTAVFTVIALDKLELDKGLQTIVLAPTREIASQISSVIAVIGSQYKGLNVAVVMGGLPVKEDIEKFKENVHIVVGSPGRLRHLIQDKHIDVSGVRLFVLDEADKLMESSFQPDVNYIFSLLPKQKQVIMSSATYSEETKSFIAKYVQKAQHICPDSNSVLLGIEQKVTIVPYNSNIVKQTKHRYEELKKILNEKQFKQCLIFCNYQVRVGELHRMLSRDKWPAEQLYGKQEQTDRLDALKTLQEYKCRILVSTDLAARGIDASNIDVVINFEPPFEWQTYLHRIGRAGRYGSYGTAISILSEGKEKTKFKETLGHIIPFQIRGLWDDEPFNLSENITDDLPNQNQTPAISSKSSSSVNGDKTEDLLWKVLTGESFEQKLEISSFERLCDSFKMSTVASFSELMNSFAEDQNIVHNDMNSFKYKHVNVINLPIQSIKYLEHFDAEYTNKISDFPNGDPPSKITELSTTDSKMNGKSLNETRDAQKQNERHSKGSMKKECSKLMSNCKNDTSEYRVQKEKLQMRLDKFNICEAVKQNLDLKSQSNQSHEAEIDHNKQALLDAGLPTAFGKTKIIKNSSYNCKNENATMKKGTLEQLIQYSPNKAKNKIQRDIKRTDSNKTFIKQYNSSDTVNESYQSESSSDMDEKSDQLNYSSEISKAVKHPKNELKNNYAKYASSTFNNEYCNQKKSKQYKNRIQNRSKQFDLWYNQLKHHMQFIQYTLYIEELRKL